MSKRNTGLAKKPANNPPATKVPAIDPAMLNQIIEWVVSGATEHSIRESIKLAYPDLDAKSAVMAAMLQVEKNADADPVTVMAWTFEAAREMYRRMVEANDFGGALKALKFMNDTAAAMADRPKADPDVPDPATQVEAGQ